MNRILSLFDCPLKDVQKLLPIINSQGFNAVQVSPLQPTKDDNSKDWWILYQPLCFDIGNRIGNKEDLYNLCLEAKKYGINIIVDAVINHTANKNDDEALIPHPNVDKELLLNSDCFKERKWVSNWDNRYEVTNYCIGLPGLNPNNKIVTSKITTSKETTNLQSKPVKTVMSLHFYKCICVLYNFFPFLSSFLFIDINF